MILFSVVPVVTSSSLPSSPLQQFRSFGGNARHVRVGVRQNSSTTSTTTTTMASSASSPQQQQQTSSIDISGLYPHGIVSLPQGLAVGDILSRLGGTPYDGNIEVVPLTQPSAFVKPQSVYFHLDGRSQTLYFLFHEY